MCLAAITQAATNPNFNNALGQAKRKVESIDGVKVGDWDDFIAHLHSTGQYAVLLGAKGRQDFFKDKLVELFDHWRSNKAVADHEGLDDDVREEFRSESDGTASGDAESEPVGGGTGSVGGGTTRTSQTKRTLHSVASPARGYTRTDVLLKELDKLRHEADLTHDDAVKTRAAALGDADENIRESNLRAFIANDHLRASYIKVLLSEPTHRDQVVHAIVEGADHDDFRTALIDELLRNDGTRGMIVDRLHGAHHTQLVNKIHEGGNRAEMITKLNGHEASRPEVISDLLTNHLNSIIDAILPTQREAIITKLLSDATNRDAIAQAFVDNDDFRAVLIRLLGVGHSDALIDTLRATQLEAMITSLLGNHMGNLVARISTNNDFRNAVIASLLDDVTNRNAIATLFVGNDAFRAALISLLETGHYAINITRMVWHAIDGDQTSFWTGMSQIVTKAAFDHLLAKTAEGYQNISRATLQRGNFRSAFATDNQVGKTGRDLGSSEHA
jgi:hypothetical protein